MLSRHHPGCGGESVARRSRKLVLACEIYVPAMQAWSRSRARLSVSSLARRRRMLPVHDCAGGYAIWHAGVQGGSEESPWKSSTVTSGHGRHLLDGRNRVRICLRGRAKTFSKRPCLTQTHQTEQTALLRWHRPSPTRLVGGVAETFSLLPTVVFQGGGLQSCDSDCTERQREVSCLVLRLDRRHERRWVGVAWGWWWHPRVVCV